MAIVKPVAESLIKELESSIGIQEGFFRDLADSKFDWSFVVGLYAFLEAAMTMLIVKAIAKEQLHGAISGLPMGQSQYGKMAFIKRLSLLSGNAVRFVQALSELRNRYVHDIKTFAFSLEEYLVHLDDKHKRNFIEAFGYVLKDEIEIGQEKIKKEEFIRENPRFTIEFSAFFTVWEIAVKLGEVKLKYEENELNKRSAELFRLFYPYFFPKK